MISPTSHGLVRHNVHYTACTECDQWGFSGRFITYVSSSKQRTTSLKGNCARNLGNPITYTECRFQCNRHPETGASTPHMPCPDQPSRWTASCGCVRPHQRPTPKLYLDMDSAALNFLFSATVFSKLTITVLLMDANKRNMPRKT